METPLVRIRPARMIERWARSMAHLLLLEPLAARERRIHIRDVHRGDRDRVVIARAGERVFADAALLGFASAEEHGGALGGEIVGILEDRDVRIVGTWAGLLA